MHFRLQLIAVLDDGTEHLQEVADVARPATTLETLGLTLDESKCLLEQVQHTMIEYQVAGYLDPLRGCPDCGKNRRLKDSNRAPFRTLFGLVRVLNPRWHHCDCRVHSSKTFRPLAALLPERTSPELRYLETKWASLIP